MPKIFPQKAIKKSRLKSILNFLLRNSEQSIVTEYGHCNNGRSPESVAALVRSTELGIDKEVRIVSSERSH